MKSATLDITGCATPVVFTKPPSTVVADGDAVLSFGAITRQLDHEAELAVVIGTPGRGIARAAALGHVWGYTIINGVTARDLICDIPTIIEAISHAMTLEPGDVMKIAIEKLGTLTNTVAS